MSLVRYTSWVDLLVRLALGVVALGVIAVATDLLTPIAIRDTLLSHDQAQYLSIAVALFGTLAWIILIPGDVDEQMAALCSFLYALVVLNVFLRWSEAKAVANLFSNNGYETWYPMTYVAAFPYSDRKKEIFAVAHQSDRLLPPITRHRRLQLIVRKGGILLAISVLWLVALSYFPATRAWSHFGLWTLGTIPLIVLWGLFLGLHAISYTLYHVSNR